MPPATGGSRLRSTCDGAATPRWRHSRKRIDLLRWRSWQAEPPALHFLRVRGGREVETIRIPGVRPKARRLGLMGTRGREIERLAPHVWAVPHWRLFGPIE